MASDVRSAAPSKIRAFKNNGPLAEDGPAFQTTLKSSIICRGVGLHSGVRVAMTLHPAEADTGIVFKRIDIVGGGAEIPARWDRVTDARMCTVIANDDGVSVATVEHLMSAFAGMRIDNALVEITGPEVPAMDGSAAPFVFLIECAGVEYLDAPRKALKVLKTVTHAHDGKSVCLSPSDEGLQVDFSIDFTAPAIGQQSCSVNITTSSYKTGISKARTFGFLSEVTALREAGLALGGSLDNAIVVDGDRILNDGGLRMEDEFVRHKALDAIGDLYLLGHPIIGRFEGVKSSHADTASVLRTLFSDPANYTLVDWVNAPGDNIEWPENNVVAALG